MTKVFKIIVELYELLITGRKDDRIGRVVSIGSLKVDDLIHVAVTRRTDLNPVTLKAAYEILKETAIEEVCGGRQVEFGLTHCRLNVNGVFIGDHASWSDGEHKLFLQATPTAEVRNALKNITVEVRGMAQSGAFINMLTDVATGEINTRITPSGGVNVTGVKIKVAGNAPGVGIFLTEINGGDPIMIPATSILINDPSKISFIVPSFLSPGDYRLSIVTQFSGNTTLKEPRTCVFDSILACG
jgi:hypothetical protein